MGLGTNDVHVWTAIPEEATDRNLVAACVDCLSAAERQRMARFHFETDRHTYLVAHALVRHALSAYAPVAPGAWSFDIGDHGRPEIAAGQCDRPLRFNLSHTRGLVAVAVALERDLGVDVEHVRPRSFTLDVADHYFSGPEVAALRALPLARRRDRFFTYWTLKESYIKARGLGLALPLDQFGFELDAGPAPVLWVDESLGDRAGSWWFEARTWGAEHRLAVALRTGGGDPPSLRVSSGRQLLWREPVRANPRE